LTKDEWRVLAQRTASSHWLIRTKLMAAAVKMCVNGCVGRKVHPEELHCYAKAAR
jgi:hypothetical protein